MRMRRLTAAALVAMAMTGSALPVHAESSGYTMSPAGPTDAGVNSCPRWLRCLSWTTPGGKSACAIQTTRTINC